MAQISEITIEDLGLDSRLDSEYYQPQYIKALSSVDSVGAQRLADIGKFIIGPFGSTIKIEDYVEVSNSRYIRGKDVKNYFIDDLDNAYILDSRYQELKKYHIAINDLLITVVGTLGNVSVVTEDVGNAIYSCKSTILRPATILPGYLCIYLNTKQGHGLLMRNERGAVQTGFNLKDLENVALPRFGDEFEIKINNQYFDANNLRRKSKELYRAAESLLLHSLELENFKQEWITGYETTYDNLIGSARMDAEYFQPRYIEIIKAIKRRDYFSIKDISHFVGHSSQPDYVEDGDIAVLAQKHMGSSLRLNYENFDNFTNNENIKNTDKKYVLQNNDILISSAGNPGLTTIWQSNQKAIPGSFVTVVRAKNVNPLYIGLCLNSKIGKMQFEQNFTGSVQQYVYPSKISDIIIPKVGPSLEKEISEKVQKSFDYANESYRILQMSKLEIEEAINNRKIQ